MWSGFKDLHLFNIAMLGKMSWGLIMEPYASACPVLKGFYFPNGDNISDKIVYYFSLHLKYYNFFNFEIMDKMFSTN